MDQKEKLDQLRLLIEKIKKEIRESKGIPIEEKINDRDVIDALMLEIGKEKFSSYVFENDSKKSLNAEKPKKLEGTKRVEKIQRIAKVTSLAILGVLLLIVMNDFYTNSNYENIWFAKFLLMVIAFSINPPKPIKENLVGLYLKAQLRQFGNIQKIIFPLVFSYAFLGSRWVSESGLEYTQVDTAFWIFIVTSLILSIRLWLIHFRIKRGYFGNNRHEALQLISFIQEKLNDDSGDGGLPPNTKAFPEIKEEETAKDWEIQGQVEGV